MESPFSCTSGAAPAFAAAGNGSDIITDWGMGDRISVAGASFSGAVTAGTGEAVALSGKYVPHFKPGKDLRERVNDGAGRPIRD